MNERNVFVTGANGFVGSFLVKILQQNNFRFAGSVRAKNLIVPPNFPCKVVDDISGLDPNSRLFQGCDTVVHLANIAASPKKRCPESSCDKLRDVNVSGTERALRCAAHNGVERFVYLSSLKAIGERSSNSQGLSSNTQAAPECSYGKSKLAAEHLIQQLAPELGIEYVIIRPPLVYGPNAKGNFDLIVRLVKKGIPLPFKAVTNQRSIVYVGNLVDLIIRCIDHPAAANKIFMVSDGKDLSLPQLIQLISANMGVKNRSFLFPETIFWLVGALSGRSEICQKLFGSARVDMSHTVKTLNWQPPYTVEEGIHLSVTNSSENSD